MTSFRWTASVLLLLLSALICSGNLWISVRWYIWKKRESLIPFLGGVLGAVGLALLPVDPVSRYWWLPPLVDPGCVLLLVAAAVEYIRKRGSLKAL
jgi:hypothetical protein